jgi:ABC-type bacteriocin/lantibiotic exporter with double-glycine peptidase domain
MCSALEIIHFLRKEGLSARLVRCGVEDLAVPGRAAILVLKSANDDSAMHFSLVIAGEDRVLSLVDPTVAVEPVPLDEERLRGMWGGLAIEVQARRGGSE